MSSTALTNEEIRAWRVLARAAKLLRKAQKKAEKTRKQNSTNCYRPATPAEVRID